MGESGRYGGDRVASPIAAGRCFSREHARRWVSVLRCVVAVVLAWSSASLGVATASSASDSLEPPSGMGTAACPAGEVPPSGMIDVPAGSANIDCLLWWGISRGATGNTYDPGAPVVRSQMATFLVRTIWHAGGTFQSSGQTDRFSDLTSSPHNGSIWTLADAGIVTGYPDGTYRSRVAVRRDQMASFMVRSIEHVLGAPMASSPTFDAFTDDDGNLHEAAINKLALAGIVAGRTAGHYDPAGLVTRGQMASYLMRSIEQLVAGRAELVRIELEGIEFAGVTGALIVDDFGTRGDLVPGTFAVAPDGAVRAFFSGFASGEETTLTPQESPVTVDNTGSALHHATARYAFVPNADLETPDPMNSAKIVTFYRRWFWAPASSWNGSIPGCQAGTLPDADRANVLGAINAARALVALPAVGEDSVLSAKAQQAALMMAANGAASSAPPSSWSCYSEAGAEAAAHSLLSYDIAGAPAIERYLTSDVIDGAALLARRRILDPRLAGVGIGQVEPADYTLPRASVLWPDASAAAATAAPITWPSAGMFPEVLVGQRKLWSLTAAGVALDQATVTATRNGHSATVDMLHRAAGDLAGAGAVVFQVQAGTWDEVTVTVTAPGFTHTWTTTLVV